MSANQVGISKAKAGPKNPKLAGKSRAAKKRRIEPIDPLQITEDLGIQTFRRGARKPWSHDEDKLLVSLVQKALSRHGIFINDVSRQASSTSENENDLASNTSYHRAAASNKGTAKAVLHNTNGPLSTDKTERKLIFTTPLPQGVTNYHDLVSWDQIAKQLCSRKPKDCRKRWSNSLDPNLKKGRWTKAEDDLLLASYQAYGPAWQKVAVKIPGRTDDQCAKRYIEVLDPSMTQDRLRSWSVEEDLKLIGLVKQHGTRWRTILFGMKSRPSLTCRNRWRKIITDVTRDKADPRVKVSVEGMKEFPGVVTNSNDGKNMPALALGSVPSSNSNPSLGSMNKFTSNVIPEDTFNSFNAISASAPSTPTLTLHRKLSNAAKTRVRTKSVSSTPSYATPVLSLDLGKPLLSHSHYSIPTSSGSDNSTAVTTPVTQLSKNFERTMLAEDYKHYRPHDMNPNDLRHINIKEENIFPDSLQSENIRSEAERTLVGLQNSIDDDINPRTHLGNPLQSPVVLTEDSLPSDFFVPSQQQPNAIDNQSQIINNNNNGNNSSNNPQLNYKPSAIVGYENDKKKAPGMVLVNGKQISLPELFNSHYNDVNFDASNTSVADFFGKLADCGLRMSVFNSPNQNTNNNSDNNTTYFGDNGKAPITMTSANNSSVNHNTLGALENAMGDSSTLSQVGLNYLLLQQFANKFSAANSNPLSGLSSSNTASSSNSVTRSSSASPQLRGGGTNSLSLESDQQQHLQHQQQQQQQQQAAVQGISPFSRKHQKQASAGNLGFSKRSPLAAAPPMHRRRKSVSSSSSTTSSRYSGKSPKYVAAISRSNNNSTQTTPYAARNINNIPKSALSTERPSYDLEDLEEGIDFWDNIRYLKPAVGPQNTNVSIANDDIPAGNNGNVVAMSNIHPGGGGLDPTGHHKLQTHSFGHLTPYITGNNQGGLTNSSASSQNTIQQLPVSEHHPLHYEQAANSFEDSAGYGMFYDYNYENELEHEDEESTFAFFPFNPS